MDAVGSIAHPGLANVLPHHRAFRCRRRRQSPRWRRGSTRSSRLNRQAHILRRSPHTTPKSCQSRSHGGRFFLRIVTTGDGFGRAITTGVAPIPASGAAYGTITRGTAVFGSVAFPGGAYVVAAEGIAWDVISLFVSARCGPDSHFL